MDLVRAQVKNVLSLLGSLVTAGVGVFLLGYTGLGANVLEIIGILLFFSVYTSIFVWDLYRNRPREGT